MTVHGAKGLEAIIVILTDNCRPPDARQEPKPLMVPSPDGSGFMPFWRWGKTVESRAMTALRQEVQDRMLAEYRRLLYVGLTRARDELYVCGFCTTRTPNADSWFSLVEAGLSSTATADENGILRIGNRHVVGTEAGVKTIDSSASLPDWFARTVEPVSAPPARASTRLWASPPPGSPLAKAIARGRAMHALFQHLPDLDISRRPVIGRRILARHGIAADTAESILAEVAAVLDHPDHAVYFSRHSLAEIPVLAGGLTGRIDRIVVTSERILLLDFKTDRDPPDAVETVPAAYVSQLAAYARALQAVFAGRTVEAALLWTAIPRLMPIPAELLTRHMTAM
jgi:ATP-dependent helicase/nuclease subunit A